MSKQREVEVVAHWSGLGGPELMGHLFATPIRGKEVFAFEYDKAWLSSGPRQQLDPSMALYGGPQYPPRVAPTSDYFSTPHPTAGGVF